MNTNDDYNKANLRSTDSKQSLLNLHTPEQQIVE